MQKMTDSEWRAFISEGTRTGKLCTLNRDGRPHCVPVWCVLEGDAIIFMTQVGAQKARNIQRDARVALAFDTHDFPYDFVTVEGTAEVRQVPQSELLEASRKIAARYVPTDRVEEYARRNATDGEALVIVTPTKVLSATGVAN